MFMVHVGHHILITAKSKKSGFGEPLDYSMYCMLCTGAIYTARELVFNANQPAIHLVVTATDHGSPVHQSTAITVQIRVQDINDHAPQFTLASYR